MRKKRTIDERLDALAESLELLTGMHRATERELRRFSRLARLILINHEERLRDLEGPDDGDEPGKRP